MALVTVVPDLTVTSGNWTSQGGTGQTAHLVLADDSLTTWFESPVNPAGETLKVGLSDFTPGVAQDIRVEMDIVQVGTGTLSTAVFQIYEGATLRVTRTVVPRLLASGESPAWEFLWTPEEKAAVGNFNNLQAWFIASGGQKRIRVYRFKMFTATDPTELQPGQWAYDVLTGLVYVRVTGNLNPAQQKVSIFDWRFGTEEIVVANTAGQLVGRLCRHFSYITDAVGQVDACRGGSASYDGSRVAFASNRGGGAVGVYVVLTDPRL